MSHWNYRITRETVGPSGDYIYSLREVYYDDDGKEDGWSSEPCDFSGGTYGEVIHSLRVALTDARNLPVLDIDED